MKLHILLFGILLCLSCPIAFAQTKTDTVKGKGVVFRERRGVRLDTNLIYYDESGNALRYNQMQKLLNTGDYQISLSGMPGAATTKYYIKKMTADQRADLYERLKSMMAIESPRLQENSVLDINPLLGFVKKNQLDQKIIVMMFWSAGCPPCTESFSALNDFFGQVKNPNKITILAISPDNKSDGMEKLKEKPLENTTLVFNGGKIMEDYEFKSYPAFVVTDISHVIRFASKGLGPVSIAAFKSAILSALKQ
jgi:hypothetical protein